MKDAPRTVAPQRHLLSRPRPSPNQHQISISVSPSPTLELARTPSTIWGASVRGASFVLPWHTRALVASQCVRGAQRD
jgi:hypothetical protein